MYVCACACIGIVPIGSWGSDSYWHWEEDQGRCGGGSQISHALCWVCLQRRRKTGQNRRIQGHLTGQKRKHRHYMKFSGFTLNPRWHPPASLVEHLITSSSSLHGCCYIITVIIKLRVISVGCGDHEEGDRCWWCRPLQSSLSAKEEKRFLLQRSWQRLQSVRGQRVSNY